MIKLELEPYCQTCLDFSPDVSKPDRYRIHDDEIIVGDTIVQCEYRRRCAGLKRYLEKQLKGDAANE